ncbi:MAG: universal stress protein [Candidatus Dormibacteraeota bacterium]|nr:universal stress protein [Candidatus Dormibacteraeota bacterium]MBV8445284.1 universal stress protein [Candidatus Dormibacteraeota bacterium]
MRRILVGVDGSAESLRAVAWVAELAKDLHGLEVVAAAAYNLEPSAAYGAMGLSDDFWQRWRDELQRGLDGAWTAPLRTAGLTVTTHVEEGQPEDVLSRLARERSIDLIVVGSRGRGYLRGMFLGSVSHALALHAPCPVVILPHEHEHEEHAA